MAERNPLHDRGIIIDAVCPLLRDPKHLNADRKGGLTAVAPTVNDFVSGTVGTLKSLGSWLHRLRTDDTLLQVRVASDIQHAKAAGKLGIILHFQGGDALENDVNLVDVYKALGVGVIQLTYNEKNRIGDGCEERTDAGLSKFRVAVIRRMNAVGVLVDCSHTGRRTTMEAIKHSTQPVVISHAGAAAVHASPRNISDEQIQAIAATGGLVGAVAYPRWFPHRRDRQRKISTSTSATWSTWSASTTSRWAWTTSPASAPTGPTPMRSPSAKDSLHRASGPKRPTRRLRTSIRSVWERPTRPAT